MKSKPGFSLADMRQTLYAAVVCDALDAVGRHQQSPALAWPTRTSTHPLVGRCKTTLWADLYHDDPAPYELELQAVDACRPDDVLIAAAGGSQRSGVWGELLTTAALNAGCVGAIVDGCIRDTLKIEQLEFPVFARGTSVYDSQNRQRVTDVDVPVEIGGVVFCPGDLVIADADGVVVIPRSVEGEVLELAWKKVTDENRTRDAIRGGMKATEAYRKYGVL